MLARLHVITHPRPGRRGLEVVRAALRAGVDSGAPPVIQVRVADDVADRDAYQFAAQVATLCRDAQATCLVNDRLHVALAVGAHGGHVGDEDLPVPAARRVLGETAVVGATARTPQTAKDRVAEGASYLGVGPAYRSASKTGLPDPIGPDGVGAVAAAVDVPVIAIGGVTADRVPELLAAGAYGVAVIGAINDAADPYAATRDFLAALRRP